MFGTILAIITGLGPAVLAIGNKISDLLIARQQAKTQEEIANVNQRIEEAHDKRAVLVAEAGSRINASARLLLALGPIVILSKILIWDKSIGPFFDCVGKNAKGCGMFTTDALDPNLWWVVLAVVGFFTVSTMRR